MIFSEYLGIDSDYVIVGAGSTGIDTFYSYHCKYRPDE